jgi:pimeloyl-ACP methyl ester carboxylesterase
LRLRKAPSGTISAKSSAKSGSPRYLFGETRTQFTPPFVAQEFHRLIPNSELRFIDKCGHAPMMEQPEEFNACCEEFLTKIKKTAATLA